LSLSPDGKKLAYSAILNESKILTMGMTGDSPDGSEPVSITREVGYRNLQPSWSPDSQSLAFTQIQKSRPAQVVVVRLDGTPPVTLNPSPYSQFYPQYSRDGTQVSYQQGGPQAATVATNVADGATRVLGKVSGQIQQVEKSPDGTEIAYSDVSGNVMH